MRHKLLVAALASFAAAGVAAGAGVFSESAPPRAFSATGAAMNPRAEAAVSPCALSGTRPCVRLQRSNPRGKPTKQGRTTRGRNELRRARSMKAGRRSYLRLRANAAARGETVRVSIPIKDLPGLAKSRISIVRKRGFRKCEIDQVDDLRVVIDCRRAGRPKMGVVVICIDVPVSAAPTGNPKVLRARAAIRGLKRSGWSQVNIQVRPKTPLRATPPTPTPRPAPVTIAKATAEDCPASEPEPDVVHVSPGGPGRVVARNQPLVQTDAAGRVTQIVCSYTTTPAGRSNLVIRWTYGDGDPRRRAGACADARGDPFFDTISRSWVSTMRELQATWDNRAIALVNPPEELIMVTLLKKLEAEQVGAPCE